VPYAPAVDSGDVTAAQADALANTLAPMLGYLTRLRDRLQQRSWPGSDPLYVDTNAARDAMHRLHLTLRELSRKRHVTSQERRPWEPGGSAR
jgi:hypothetical protein